MCTDPLRRRFAGDLRRRKFNLHEAACCRQLHVKSVTFVSFFFFLEHIQSAFFQFPLNGNGKQKQGTMTSIALTRHDVVVFNNFSRDPLNKSLFHDPPHYKL